MTVSVSVHVPIVVALTKDLNSRAIPKGFQRHGEYAGESEDIH